MRRTSPPIAPPMIGPKWSVTVADGDLSELEGLVSVALGDVGKFGDNLDQVILSVRFRNR